MAKVNMRRSPPPLSNVANVSIAETTPTACSASTEQFPIGTYSQHADGRRRSPCLAGGILGLHQNV